MLTENNDHVKINFCDSENCLFDEFGWEPADRTNYLMDPEPETEIILEACDECLDKMMGEAFSIVKELALLVLKNPENF